MENRKAVIEWFSMLKEKFVKTEYEGYLDMAITALKKLEVIQTCTPPSDDWEHYADRLHDIAYQNGYEHGKKDAEQDKWIPVTERPPETDYELWSDPVFVTRRAYYPNGEKWYKVEIATYCEELLSSDGIYRDIPGWAIGKDVYNTDCIVAWCPLPTPYQEEEA